MFLIRATESGSTIDRFATKSEAETALAEYEADDKRDGTDSPNFYEIVPALPLSEPEKKEIRDALEIIKAVTSEYSYLPEPDVIIDLIDSNVTSIETLVA